MDEFFDALAKDASGKLSRRQVFGRLAFGMAASMLAAVGVAHADGPSSECAQCCASQCRSLNSPSGDTPGECMRDCLQGGSTFTDGTCTVACNP